MQAAAVHRPACLPPAASALLLQVMISGVTGEPFPVDIYIGVVYYQRLRHMVSDKFQVGAGCCWVQGRVLGGNCTGVLCKDGERGRILLLCIRVSSHEPMSYMR